MRKTEKSLVLIKPDAVERKLVGQIISMYEEHGLSIIAMKLVKLDKAFAEAHYKEHREKDFFNELIKTITRSEIVAIVLQGDNAIENIRKINGSTNPEKAEEGTIRKRFALNKTENSVHASDSEESAEREIKLWFPELNIPDGWYIARNL